jgi:hypothetical protein
MTLNRWTWTFAGYWAKNIKVSVLDQGLSWPGFGYTDEEEETIGKLAEWVSKDAYGWGVILNAVMFVAVVALESSADHRGRWERTPFRAYLDELVARVLDNFPWIVAERNGAGR